MPNGPAAQKTMHDRAAGLRPIVLKAVLKGKRGNKRKAAAEQFAAANPQAVYRHAKEHGITQEHVDREAAKAARRAARAKQGSRRKKGKNS